MNNLPVLTVSEPFIVDIMKDQPPCFALGFIDDGTSDTGFIIMRPELKIPNEFSYKGFSFGHSVIGSAENPVLHFAFNFYGYKIFHGLAPSGNPIIHAVIDKMVTKKDYFFMAINPDNSIITFRSQMETDNLVGLKNSNQTYTDKSCYMESYNNTLDIFRKKINPSEQFMHWSCRHNWDYLNIKKAPLALNPK